MQSDAEDLHRWQINVLYVLADHKLFGRKLCDLTPMPCFLISNRDIWGAFQVVNPQRIIACSSPALYLEFLKICGLVVSIVCAPQHDFHTQQAAVLGEKKKRKKVKTP